MVLKTRLNIKVMVILMTLSAAFQGFSSENNPENHSKSINIRGVTSLVISYTTAHLTLLESDNDELVLKEYTNEQNPENFGNIFLEGSALSIIEGPRMSPNQTNVKIDVYIPRSYRENCSIYINSGALTSEKDLILKNLVIELSDGSITLGRVSAENIHIKSANGNIKMDYGEGSMRLDTISGSIVVQSARGAGTFKTSLGRIAVGMAYVTGDLLFETGIGAIALSLPGELSFHVDALTGSGNIRLYAPDKQYRVNNSGPMNLSVGSAPVCTIRSRTGVGNITINMNAPALGGIF
ncbi:MAG: DUF4097 domain-containing protein [Spirochaetaceae bacterium]|jgi:DUF4097 and DUF4098 domain-containing protein YvlB|nr:DUF4097 domain-containing protein [Spirochaetaceae bacterium]